MTPEPPTTMNPDRTIYLVNCDSFFGDVQLNGPNGATVNLPGICSSVRSFMQNRGIITDEFTLQWDPADQALRQRRQRQACSGYCTADNRAKQNTLFGRTGRAGTVPPVTNCDEFPFAGSMEGGSAFLGLNPNAPLGVTRTCVAAYQNDMQGQCNCE